MDKFVVRTPRQSKQFVNTTKEKIFVQVPIESLQRVVVLEELEKHKGILEYNDQSKEHILFSLNELSQKTPSKEVILSSGIGNTILNLVNHENAEIARLARNLNSSWTKNVLEKKVKPKIDVRYDVKTEKLRSSAKRLLARALKKSENDHLIITAEKLIFDAYKGCNNLYKRTMQKIVLSLQNREDYRRDIISGKLRFEEFLEFSKPINAKNINFGKQNK